MRETQRKCDTCKYNFSDFKGTYCGCMQNSEYGLYSVYGWCDHYERDIRFGGQDLTTKRRDFYIQEMNITFDSPMTFPEMEALLKKALTQIGVVRQEGTLS